MVNLKPDTHIKPLRFFLTTNRKLLPLMLVNSICYGLGTLGMVGVAYYVGQALDHLQSDPELLRRSIMLLVASLVFREAAYRIGHMIEVKVQSCIRANTKKALFAYTSKLSFGYFADRFAGQISHQINTAAGAFERMEETIINKFIDNAWLLIFTSAALIGVYKPLGLVMLCWFVFYLAGVLFLSRKITAYAEDLAAEESNTTGALVDMYTNVAAVKVYGRDFDQERINGQIEREKSAQVALGTWDVITYAFQGFCAVLLGILVLITISHGYILGIVTIGGIAAASAMILRIIEFVYETGHVISSFVRSNGECSQALRDIIVSPDILDGAAGNISWKTVDIAYDHVLFSYDKKRNIFEDFSLHIPAKQRIGIVGLSGAGKTTIINLLLRFFDPQDGIVFMNDVDISTITQESLRSHISFISQDTSLFHTTIAENIQYGSSSVAREQIIEAANQAYADEFIQLLPHGYDTVVGERGVKLSGGQRQRIAIARAMLKNAPIFLLDEATSALDSDSEAKVQKALKTLMEDKTVITIAHRLSTLQFMDRIVCIENGKIIEDGTHDELLKQGGRYATLWNMQAGGFLPDEV